MSSPLRILITNDDGINAEGIAVLEQIARTLSDDVWVVAPEVEQSGAGHSLTINHPLRARALSPTKFAVNGTPTDCVLMAVRALVPQDKKIDLVLSGVNRGQNVAEDITHSGTIAGAMEGTLFDIPSIAFSQQMEYAKENGPIHWENATHYTPGIIHNLLKSPWPLDTLFNINFPDCAPEAIKGIRVTPHGKREMPKELTRGIDPKGRVFYWLNCAGEQGDIRRRPGSDIEWLAQGYITITPICLDLTHYSILQDVKDRLER